MTNGRVPALTVNFSRRVILIVVVPENTQLLTVEMGPDTEQRILLLASFSKEFAAKFKGKTNSIIPFTGTE